MANITKKPNGTFLIRVSNGMKNGRQDLVSTIYKPPVGSTPAMAKKAAETPNHTIYYTVYCTDGTVTYN